MTTVLELDSELPASVRPFVGRILDVDTHEMLPVQVWTDTFGPIAADIVEAYVGSAFNSGKSNMNCPDFKGDVLPITHTNVWTEKGPAAPGAADMRRRLEVLDFMGVRKASVYPTSVGLFGALLRAGLGDYISVPNRDLGEYSEALFAAHNEWALGQQTSGSPRLTFPTVLQGTTPEDVYARAERQIRGGAKMILLLSNELLGGRSPAHADHDRFWALLSESNVPATLHVGSDSKFLTTEEWGNAPVFQGYRRFLELSLAPWETSVIHLAAQNYVATMVTGAVFERHPNLRFGITELGGHWIGPLLHLLDMYWENGGINVRGKRDTRLPHPPSFYIRRNIRVSSFDFENVDDYIRVYGLEDVLCYASDFPHVEGGNEPMAEFAARLEPLGPEIMEKFFVTNGLWLLPD